MLPNFVKPIFRSFFEATTITTNFIKITFLTHSLLREIIRLFAVFNNKGLGNFIVRPNRSIPTEMNTVLMESVFNYKCYEIGYAELSEKMTVSVK